MRFGMVGQSGPWMRQVVGFGDRSTRRGNFGSKWGLFNIGNSNCAAVRLLLGEFLELQACRAGEACRLSARYG